MLKAEPLVTFLLGVKGTSLTFNEEKTELLFSMNDTPILPFKLNDDAVAYMDGSFAEHGSRETLKRLFIKGVGSNLGVRIQLHKLFIEVTKPRSVMQKDGEIVGSVSFDTNSVIFVLVTTKPYHGHTVHKLGHAELMYLLEDNNLVLNNRN